MFLVHASNGGRGVWGSRLSDPAFGTIPMKSPELDDYRFRLLTAADESIVWTMTAYAACCESLAQAKQQPGIARYARNWGAARGDIGWVALSEGQPVGAAWMRLWVELDSRSEGDRGYGHVSDDIPELGIAVVPGERRKGLGTHLLTKALTLAQEHYGAVSLSVLVENPAISLYRRMGFEPVYGDFGGNSPSEPVALTMLKQFSSKRT